MSYLMGTAWPFAHKIAEKKDGAVLLSAEGVLSKSGNETRQIAKKDWNTEIWS